MRVGRNLCSPTARRRRSVSSNAAGGAENGPGSRLYNIRGRQIRPQNGVTRRPPGSSQELARYVRNMSMSSGKMHADEVHTDVELVRRLLAVQFPQWAALPIEPVPSAGTDNAIYRLGDAMAVRLPR